MAVAASPVTVGGLRWQSLMCATLTCLEGPSKVVDGFTVLMVTLKHRGPLTVAWELHLALAIVDAGCGYTE